MDRVNKYRSILQRLITQQAEYPPSHGKIETLPIADLRLDNYLLVGVGWDNTGRVHAPIFHARLREGKVWIEWDGVEPSLTEALVEAGIPKQDIVLGFYRPEFRSMTEYAVA